MALETLATPIRHAIATVEPSRAWILGLVVESDGSVSGPVPEQTAEWPAVEGSRSDQPGRAFPGADGIDHDNP